MAPLATLLVSFAALPRGPTALAVFDAYLHEAARRVPEYRTDLGPAGPAPLPSGVEVVASRLAGPVRYRPKTFAELSESDRSILLRSPELRAYMRAAGRFAPGARVVARVNLDPAELLRPGAECVAGLPPSPREPVP
ncbi:MAG: hypothetical protein ACREFX_09180 [Opitutaceae bacterium]